MLKEPHALRSWWCGGSPIMPVVTRTLTRHHGLPRIQPRTAKPAHSSRPPILIPAFSVRHPDAGRQQEIVVLDPGNWITDVPILKRELPVEPATEFGGNGRIKSSPVLSGVAQIWKK